MRRIAITLVLLVILGIPAFAQTTFPPITAKDRIIVVAPHPDDEVLGAGGLIQQACAVGAEVHVIYLTSGDHNQIAFKLYNLRLHLSPKQYVAFGILRQAEATRAMAGLGLSPEQLTFLGYPDYGTMQIWRDYWNADTPFRSDATRSNAVPYEEAFAFGQPYVPENVVADFVELFRRYRPTRVFVTHPADTNPDHRAAANFVRLATLEIAAEQSPPQIYYYLVHFGRWPHPYHYHPELGLEPPPQLLDDGDWLSFPLTPEQRQKKYESILQNHTQLTTRQYYLVSFARANEIFATISLLSVPVVPVEAVIDWKAAAHSKAIGLGMGDPSHRTDTERALFDEFAAMELEETAYVRQGSDLIAQVTLRNRLGKRANVHLLLYGYKRGAAFATMPKLHINVTPLGGVHVFDGGKRLKETEVTVTGVENHLIVRLPLRLLGESPPDLLFTATRANLGEVAADDTAWHLFSLSTNPGNGHTIGVGSGGTAK
ncbi:MAG TPA: PIG-L family deacetylase [Verrucomicrobiae bacterium]|nr:PIG-L family deacetylase [Verrucomicrobiae bacterium]